MKLRKILSLGLAGTLVVVLAGCSGGSGFGSGNFSTGRNTQNNQAAGGGALPAQEESRQSSFFDLFKARDNPNTTVEVNKYIWNASLDVLNFLPIQSVDPFSGVIVTGYGTPPGGGRAYRATIYVQDPALDGRSLNVALATRGGPANPATVRAVEDAILTRARQLRIRDGKL